MSEVLTEDKTRKDGTDKYTTIFNGLLAKVETPKPFNSCVYLRKDIKDQTFLVRLLSGKWKFDDLRVELAPIEFEKMFDVYTSNQEVVMKLFTTEVKQILMDFQNEMKINFEITIKNNYMYIRFNCGKMFEAAKLSKSSIDRDTLFKYYSMIDFSFELINKLVTVLNEIQCS